MRVVGLLFSLLLLSSVCFASVEAEIIAKDIDSKGNIRIWTQYKVDGVEVVSQYPKIDGKSVYVSGRYNTLSFLCMTDEERELRVLQDADTHLDTLIRKEYLKKNNLSTKEDIQTENQNILDNHLKTLVGKKITKESTVIKVSDREVIIKTDGSSVDKVIINP